MKTSLPLLAVSLLSLLAAGCVGVQLPKDQLTDPGALLFNGYANAEVGCYRCHNGDAKGGPWGPSLATRVPRRDAAKLSRAIREGKGPMPKYGPAKLSDAELEQLVGWLQTSFPAMPAAN